MIEPFYDVFYTKEHKEAHDRTVESELLHKLVIRYSYIRLDSWTGDFVLELRIGRQLFSCNVPWGNLRLKPDVFRLLEIAERNIVKLIIKDLHL